MKKSLLIAVLTVLLVSGLALVGNIHFDTAQAATNVTGVISSDTTWTKGSSPYNPTGPILVSKGVTLTIEAGVTVNDFYIQVDGTLIARGNSTDPIHLNRATIFFTEFSNSWNEQSGSGSIIENAILNLNPYIDINNTSPKINNNTINGYIQGHEGSPVISNNTFYNINITDSGIYYAKIINGRGSPVILNNNFINIGGYEDFAVIDAAGSPVISNNTIKGVIGDGIRAYQGYISNNIISGCTGTGIFVAFQHSIIERNLIVNNYHGIQVGAGVEIRNNTIANNYVGIYSPQPSTIMYNNIQNNSNYNIYLDSYATNDVNAAYNWWGTTDTSAINQSIFDKKKNFNLGTVSFVPFLAAPNSQATPDSTSTPRIPEFPSWIILALLTIATLAVAAAFRRKIQTKPSMK